MNDQNRNPASARRTRGTVISGRHAAPTPIFSPQVSRRAGLTFGTVEPESTATAVGLEGPTGYPTSVACRPSTEEPEGPATAGYLSASASRLSASDSAPSEPDEMTDGGGWSTASGRMRRVRSTTSIMTANAIHSAPSSASGSARRFGSFSKHLWNIPGRPGGELYLSEPEEVAESEVEGDKDSTEPLITFSPPSTPRKKRARRSTDEGVATPHRNPARNTRVRKPFVETTTDEDDERSRPSPKGPAWRKGKGADPRNWGNVSGLESFSEKDVPAQERALRHFAELREAAKRGRGVTTPTRLAEAPAERKRPAAPASQKETRLNSGSAAFNRATSRTKSRAPNTEQTAPGPKPPAPKTRSKYTPAEAKLLRPSPPGQVPEPDALPDIFNRLAEMQQRITALEAENQHLKTKQQRQRETPGATKNPKDDTERSPSMFPPRESTPGRVAAQSFLSRAMRGAGLNGQDPPPSDSSSSSPSSSSSSSSPCSSEYSEPRRRSYAPHRSSKRRQGVDRPKKMILKPIPPTRYNGEANTNSITRFVREATTYVKMGRVPRQRQVYFVSYHLDGKALDFYNQVVVLDEQSWDLQRFFVELFEFCFPVDFRNQQRKRLQRCYQGTKSVAAHVAEWSELCNTTGAPDNQEKTVKLFSSFKSKIQTEIYRSRVDPESATWNEVVRAAEQAEIIVEIEERNLRRAEGEYSSEELDSEDEKSETETEDSDGDDEPRPETDQRTPAREVRTKNEDVSRPSAGGRAGPSSEKLHQNDIRAAAVDIPPTDCRRQITDPGLPRRSDMDLSPASARFQRHQTHGPPLPPPSPALGAA